MKASLVSRGHSLYGAFWNDQPPLHTEAVALLFRFFGPSAYLARLLSIVLSMVLVAALYRVVSASSGRVAGLVAVGLLLVPPYFLHLGVSVMLEMPAMAAGLAAVWAWVEYSANRHWGWLVCSGLLFGCALQVKLTAAIFGLALAADFFVTWASRRRPGENCIGVSPVGVRREVAIWCGAAIGVLGLIALWFYAPGTLAVFWSSHFSAGTRAAASAAEYGFHLSGLWEDYLPVLPAAVAGVGYAACRRRRDLLLPLALLGAALITLLGQRPYWPYYGVHFAVPLAWLGAVGIVEWFRVLWRRGPRAGWWARLRVGLEVLTWSSAVSLALTMLPEAVRSQVQELQAAPRASADRVVGALRKQAPRTHWILTENLIAAFWAGLPVPPEVAVTPLKRFWSGQINEAEVRRCLERYRPELVLLDRGQVEQFGLDEYLRRHYRLDLQDGVQNLYVRQ
ncbi:MAG: ArnT family glycosyltransferase [Limisphaerales bacterium]